MAQWSYSAWPQQSTAAARLAMLRQHITEVIDKLTQEVSSDGHSRSSSTLQAHLDSLYQHERRLEAVTGEPQSKYTAHRLRVG